MWKEDVALVGIAMGLLLAYRGDRVVAGVVPAPRSRTMGLRAAGLCALWFVIATRLFIPAFSPEGGFTDQLFGELGGARKSVVEGKSVSVRVDLGGRRIIKKKKKNK